MSINPDLRNNTLALRQLKDAGLKCCPCLDNAIINDTPLDDVPPAVTMAPSVQQFPMNGNQVMAPVVLPVCTDCRKNQLGKASKTGLVVA